MADTSSHVTVASNHAALPIKTSQQSPSSRTIKLVVGDVKDVIIAHRHILETVPFFKACLDAPMQENVTSTIKLPEDRPKIIETIISYIYGQEYSQPLRVWVRAEAEVPKKTAGVMVEYLHRLSQKTVESIRLYAAAKKFGSNSLCSKVMDEIHEAYHHEQVDFVVLDYVVSTLNAGDKLVKFFLRTVAFDVALCGWADYQYKQSDAFNAFMSDAYKGKLLLEATIKQLRNSGPGQKPAPKNFGPSLTEDTFTDEDDAAIMRMMREAHTWLQIFNALGKTSMSQLQARYKELEAARCSTTSNGRFGLFD